MANHYGDPTTSTDDFTAFMPQLSAALSTATRQVWLVSPLPEHNDGYRQILLNGKYKLHCRLWRDRGKEKTDHVQITGSLDNTLGGYAREDADRNASLSIACTYSRGAQAIAADIAGRLWETYQAVYQRAEAKHMARAAAQEQRYQTALHLARILGKDRTISEEMKRIGYGDPGFTWGYKFPPHNCKGSVHVESDQRIKLEIEGLSARNAAFILQFLAGNT